MFYVVNSHLNNLYVLPNKDVGPGKNTKLITVGPTSIPDSRVRWSAPIFFLWKSAIFHSIKPPFDAKVAEKFLNGIYYWMPPNWN